MIASLPRLACAAALACMVSISAGAQPAASTIDISPAPPPILREMRAVWVATVDNMDWPSRAGLSTAEQQRELIAILDKLVALHMNTVILQVRPGADAIYASRLEPWSEYLTGEMGRAPSPWYDPLAFAVAEAHKRGLELHAWINPYRARYSTKRPASKNHISRTRPSLVRKYGPYIWMDPGDPAVRALTKKVVLDIVTRYDIDGLHMDDYFYPYKETRRGRDIPFPDASTYKRYRAGGGKLTREDWRRQNVNLLVKELYEEIHAAKPNVRFGVSPFGIWRPGYPSSVRGLDQYSELFADARKWVNEGWLDYVTPQLYWSVDKPQQRYDQLLEWWEQQNLKGRHLWPGNYTGKVGFTNSLRFPTGEILEQIRLTRAQPGATGNVHFSMKVFQDDPDSLDARLLSEVYAAPALVPASSWLPGDKLPAPTVDIRIDGKTGDRMLELKPGSATAPWLWVVQTRGPGGGWGTEILPGNYRGIVAAERGAPLPMEVRVMAVDRVGNLSPVARLAPL